MEIDLTTFQKKCPLLRFEGYVINGSNNNGFTVTNNQRDNKGAKNDLKNICGKCGCHTEGNCQPEVETGTPTAEIYAEIV